MTNADTPRRGRVARVRIAPMISSTGSRRRMMLAIASCVGIGGIFPAVALPARLEQAATGSYAVPQVTRPLDAVVTPAAASLFVVAHNAGDTPQTTRQANAHGADAVEIDVMRVDGQLRAGHSRSRVPEGWFNASRSLSRAWSQVSTPAVLLDLKTSGPALTRVLASAMTQHPGTGVLISTPDTGELSRVQQQAPTALRLRTVSTRAALAAVLENPGTAQGVSIARRVLDQPTARLLAARGLWIQVFTVNSMADVNRLAGWGVDGITTDDLNIVSALAAAPSPAAVPLAGVAA
jgi:hypothetical protein